MGREHTGRRCTRALLVARKRQEHGKNDETRAHLGKVLGAYHAEFAPLVSMGAIRAVRSTVDDFCVWYQETRTGGAEELDKSRIAWDEQFRKTVDKSIQSYLARAVPALEPNATKIFGETRTLELEIAEAAMRKAVADPLVQYYAEQMERARRGELPPAKK